ncbi:hypothetical protein MPTK1_2g19990 [Marchantia polymorpha subsp. ruderalis]|uniref:Uncharacterized protein n=1 Tax=Marchantia polymorpha TaxID=3197 RepID=A0A2R6WV95_MARPO|nr:hypothetical protein MARPO_0055s0050 [Marchantia polymorpha]BBN03015.1 hypothetical protein Mp_2g19990 [Marchantia polymorpha subsp. ruderalis]|eukprot:PTQ37773.1 hypothetical protein MARPO_0055s0050 [Marchantia polymorpha]
MRIERTGSQVGGDFACPAACTPMHESCAGTTRRRFSVMQIDPLFARYCFCCSPWSNKTAAIALVLRHASSFTCCRSSSCCPGPCALITVPSPGGIRPLVDRIDSWRLRRDHLPLHSLC